MLLIPNNDACLMPDFSYQECNVLTAMTSTLLAKGSFGCVYYPPISCDGHVELTEASQVTKIVRNKTAWDEEVATNVAVRRTDPTGEFTITSTKSCTLPFAAMPRATRELIQTTCGLAHADEETAYMLQMPYAGNTSLSALLRAAAPFPDFVDVLVGARRVFQWLGRSEKAHRVTETGHMDIKPSNIMVGRDAEDGAYAWRLIDFGLGGRFMRWMEEGTPTLYHPLDFDVYSSFLHGSAPFKFSGPRQYLEDRADYYLPRSRHHLTEADKAILAFFPTYEQTKRDAEAMLARLRSGEEPQKIASKVDVYMFGQVLFEVVLSLCLSPIHPSHDTQELGLHFLGYVVCPMMHVNVFERPDAQGAAKSFEHFMAMVGRPVGAGDVRGTDEHKRGGAAESVAEVTASSGGKKAAKTHAYRRSTTRPRRRRTGHVSHRRHGSRRKHVKLI